MINAEVKLALTELLMGSTDGSVCAQKGLEWLGRHVTSGRALLAAAATDPGRLWGIAGLGISTARTGEFVLDLDDRRDALVAVSWSGRATRFASGPRQPETPLEGTAFYAVPLRPDPQQPPVGMLLVESDEPEIDDDVLWFADVLGEKLQALRHRNITADPGVDRERHLLYSIINSVTDPILLTDESGKLIIGNLRAEQLFAIRAEESEGRRRAVEINNLFFSSALAGRLVEEALTVSREVILVDPEDGSDLLFELLTSRMALDRDTTAVVSVLRNVTDLGRARQELEANYRRMMEAEAQMRTERNRLDLLVDSVGDPIIVTDPAGDILMTNAPAERFFTAHESGKDAQRRVQSNVAQFSSFVSGLMLQSGTSGVQQRWRERVVVTDPETGRAVPMEAIAGTMMAGPSELSGVVTVLHDQTEAIERERLYAELQQASAQLEMKVREATAELAHQNELLRRQALALEQASAAKSQFLANVSHEFRTPLNAILGYSLMLMGGFYGQLSEEQQKTVQRIDANSKHLATLINDVLDIERIEAGRMPLQISQFAVPEVVREVIEELQGVIAQSPSTVVQVTLDPKLPRLKSDRQKLKQILVNLLSNALKYTKDGIVEISALANGDQGRLTLRVRDTGVGIAPEDHTRIFEPFQQAKRVITRPQGGTGLGLAISRRLARMMGGDVAVESQLGAGSTFTVELPVRVRARAPQYRPDAEHRRQSA